MAVINISKENVSLNPELESFVKQKALRLLEERDSLREMKLEIVRVLSASGDVDNFSW